MCLVPHIIVTTSKSLLARCLKTTRRYLRKKTHTKANGVQIRKLFGCYYLTSFEKSTEIRLYANLSNEKRDRS